MRLLPPVRHIPGVTPRHPEGAFDDIRARASVVTKSETARDNAAWVHGLTLFNAGCWWEAHEVWEEVWMRAPNGTPEKAMTQAAIQLANAALKVLMGKPNATRRLCLIVEDKVKAAGGGVVMGVAGADLSAAARHLSETLDETAMKIEWAEEAT